MAQNSQYDRLHDRYLPRTTIKRGTKYERLAALVLAGLQSDHAVIHDLRLVGATKVPHQIDVVLEDSEGQRRVLIECKDFDLSGQKVGLGIVRDFSAAVDDIKPDGAFIITCHGYTRDALRFAKAKGIQLAVLRVLADADWEGRLQSVHVTLHLNPPPQLHKVHLNLSGEQALVFKEDFAAEYPDIATPSDKQMIFFQPGDLNLVTEAGRVKFEDYVLGKATSAANATGERRILITLDRRDGKLQIGDRRAVDFDEFRGEVVFPAARSVPIEISMRHIVELVLKGFGHHDIWINGETLQKLSIDRGGKVIAGQLAILPKENKVTKTNMPIRPLLNRGN